MDEGRAEGRVEGQAAEARQLLLATDKLGVSDPSAREAIERIGDLAELERLMRRVLRVNTWSELLAAR